MRVPTAEGWEPIDTTLEQRASGLEPVASPVGVVVGDGGDHRIASVSNASGTAALTWSGVLPEPSVSGSRATFAGVGPDQDLVVTDDPSGYAADIVLPKAPLGTVGPWTFHFDGTGMVLKQDANDTVTLVDRASGALRGSIGDPLVYGAGGPSPDGSSPRGRANLQVLPDAAGGQDLVVSLPIGFLATPGLSYPVTVDPQVTLTTGVSDTYVQSNDAAKAHDGAPYMYAGYSGSGIYRSLIGFDTDIVTSSTGSQYLASNQGGGVTGATLTLWNPTSNSCNSSPNTLNIFEMTQSWSAPAVTWNQNVTAGAKMISSTTAAYGASGCPGNHISVDVTGAVQDWYHGVANNGFALSASNESATSDYRTFTTEEYGNCVNLSPCSPNVYLIPTLTINYYFNPDPPGSDTATPGNASIAAVFTPPVSPSTSGGYPITSYNYAVYNTASSQYVTNTNPTTNTTSTVVSTPASTDGSYTGSPTINASTGWPIVNGTPYEVIAVDCTTTTKGNVLCSKTFTASAVVTPTTYPSPIQSVTTAVGNQSVSASWAAPASNGGSAIVQYTAFLYPYGSQFCGQSLLAYQLVTSGTTVTFNTQTPGTTLSGTAASAPTNGSQYAIEIFAKNSSPQAAVTNGCTEAAGNSVGYLTGSLTPYTVPTAPGTVTATPGNGTVSGTWSAPASNGGLAVNHYYYGVYDTTTSSYTTIADSAGPSVTAPATNGDSVYLVVEACNSTNETSCGPAAGSNTVIPSGPPGAVTSLTATAAGKSVSASWTAPSSSNGSPLIGYQAYLYPNGSQFCQTNYLAVTTVTGTSVTFNSATPGTSPSGGTGTVPSNASTYIVEVFSQNSSPAATSTNGCATPAGTGPGTLSNTATPSSPPTAPNTVSLAGGNGTVTVTWTPPADNGGYAVSAYNYYFVDTNTNTTFGTGTANGSGTAASATATNGDTIVAYVPDCTSPGTYCSPYEASNPVVPSGPPGAVQSLNATAVDSEVDATWTAPTSTNGSALTGYKAYLYPSGSQFCQTNYLAVTTVTGTSVTFNASTPGTGPSGATATAPVNGTSYVVEVFAQNGSPAATSTNNCATLPGTGPGTLSNTVKPLALPGAPVAAIAAAQGQNLLVTWQQPLNNFPGSPTYPGAPVDAYLVIAYPSGSDYPSSSCVGMATTTGTVTSVSITPSTGGCAQHLQAGGTYVVRVFAHDASQASTTFNGATLSPGYGQPAPLTLPVGIQNVADSQLGLEPWWSTVTKSLGGSGTAAVNVANGNLVLSSADSTPIQAHGHISFTLNRTYNSRQLTATLPTSGTIGNGWQLNVGSAGDTDSLGMGAAGLTLNGDTIANPLAVTLVDQHGTRHLFTPRQATLTVPLLAGATGSPQALLHALLMPRNLAVAAGNLLCVDQTYTAPPGVHLALWRYITTGASSCAAAAGQPSTSLLGYVTEAPDGLRTEYDATGRTTAVLDRSGVELDWLYNTTGSGASTRNVLRDVYERTSCVVGGSAANPDGGASPTPASLGESTCRAYRFTYSSDPSSPCQPAAGAATAECVEDPAGRITQYETDANNHLIQVLNPDGSVINYLYAGASGCPAEPSANGAAALLCSASDLDGDTTTFTYATDPTSTTLPPVLSQITDRRGYPTTFAYTTTTAAGTTTISSTIVDAAPTTAGGCTSASIVCERTLYSGIDATGRVAMIQAGASSIGGTANPPSPTAAGTWLHSETAVWDGDLDPATGATAYCRLPDNAVDNDLCRDTISAGGGNPDHTTTYTYGVNGEVLSTSQKVTGGNLDTTYGYHEQCWLTSGGVSTADYTVDGNRGVTAGSGIINPDSQNVLFALSDPTQTLDPRGNAAGSLTAAAPYLRTTYPDDNTSAATTAAPNTFLGASGSVCGTTGAATSDTGLACETDSPASASTNGVATSAPTPGSCQGDPAGATVAYACSLDSYDGYGQKTTMTTPNQVAAGGKPYTYLYAADHPAGGTDPKTLDAGYAAGNGSDADTNAGGWLLAVTDPTGAFTYNAYDRAGNRVRSWDRDATAGGSATSAATFDPTALVAYPHYAQTIFGSLALPWRYPTITSTPLGETTSTTYDSEGRLLSSTTPRGNPLRSGTSSPTPYTPQCDLPAGVTAGPVPAFTTVHCFDAAGEQTSVTLPVGSTGVGGTALPGAVAATTTDSYDAYGNKISEQRPKSAASDAVAPATEWTFDAINRTTMVQVARTITQAQTPTKCPATTTDPVFTQNTSTAVYVCQTSLGYDTADDVISAVAADGGTFTYTYDGAGRKLVTTEERSTGSNGVTLTSAVIYDPDGNVTDTCPAREFSVGTGTCTDTTAYASRHFSTHTVFDAADRATLVTRYRYVDPNSPLANDASPLSSQAKALAAPQTLTHGTGFDLDGNTVTSTDANGAVTTTGYDPLDRMTSRTVPHLKTAGATDTTTSYTTTWSYDHSGDTLAAVLPAGTTGPPAGVGGAAAPTAQPRITAYAYDADHRLTDTITGANSAAAASDGAAASNGGSNIRSRRYYDADGNLIAATDPRAYTGGVPAYGNETTAYVTRYGFDPNDRPDAQYVPHATTSGSTLDGGTQAKECPAVSSSTVDTSQQGTVPVTPPAFASGTLVCTSRSAYDARGNTTVEQLPTSVGAPVNGMPADNRYTSTAYTLDDKAIGTTSPDPSNPSGNGRVATTLALDAVGRTISESDPGNGTNASPTTTTGYNLDGTVNTATAPQITMIVNGTTTTGSTVETTTYDADGNPVSVATGVAGAMHTTNTYYNSDDTVSDSLDTGGNDTRYGYDLDGNPTTTESPNEVQAKSVWSTQNSYTLDDQLASTITPVTTTTYPATVREVDYSYDPAGRRSVTHTFQGTETSIGKAVTNTADAGLMALTYLPTDLVATQVGRTTTASATITTGYDAAGNKTSVADSSNTAANLAMTYTPDNLLASYQDGSSNTHTQTYAYDATGLPTARQETGGTSSRTLGYTYDDAELPVTLTDSKISSAGSISWTYEPDGMPATRTDPTTNGTTSNDSTAWTYTGDGDPRTVSVFTSAGIVQSSDVYSYDELGRIATQGTLSGDLSGVASGQYSYSYDAAGRLNDFGTSAGHTSVAYDANGNRTTYGKQSFTYNDDNQLTSSKDTTGTTTAGVQTFSEADQTYAYYAWGCPASDFLAGRL